MGTTSYEKKKQSYVRSNTPTHITDRIANEEAYIEIYRHHPQLTKLMVYRLHIMGVTTSEIIAGECESGVFSPGANFFFSNPNDVQLYPLDVLGSQYLNWRRRLNQYNNATNKKSTRGDGKAR